MLLSRNACFGAAAKYSKKMSPIISFNVVSNNVPSAKLLGPLAYSREISPQYGIAVVIPGTIPISPGRIPCAIAATCILRRYQLQIYAEYDL